LDLHRPWQGLVYVLSLLRPGETGPGHTWALADIEKIDASAPGESGGNLSGVLKTRIGDVELTNGYPSAASVTKLYDELDFQRASQAYIWAMPAVSMEALRRANKSEWDVDYNTVSIIDNYTTPSAEILTGNDTTIYSGIFVDLSP
jgi:hypothetical protein